MARNDRGLYHLEDGNTADVVPGIVLAQYDVNGDVVVDNVAGEAAAVDSVDVLILGWSNGKRKRAAVGTDKNQFEFTDTLTA